MIIADDCRGNHGSSQCDHGRLLTERIERMEENWIILNIYRKALWRP